MADDKKLSDIEVWDRLHAALDLLRDVRGETVRGDTALKTSVQALTLIQMGHLSAMDKGSDKNPAIKDPSGS